MPNGIRNWTYKQVKGFLKDNGFIFYRQLNGTHEAWFKKTDNGDFLVNIHQPKDVFSVRTMETIVRSSGIPKKDWKL